jgi:hypothetical protein
MYYWCRAADQASCHNPFCILFKTPNCIVMTAHDREPKTLSAGKPKSRWALISSIFLVLILLPGLATVRVLIVSNGISNSWSVPFQEFGTGSAQFLLPALANPASVITFSRATCSCGSHTLWCISHALSVYAITPPGHGRTETTGRSFPLTDIQHA